MPFIRPVQLQDDTGSAMAQGFVQGSAIRQRQQELDFKIQQAGQKIQAEKLQAFEQAESEGRLREFALAHGQLEGGPQTPGATPGMNALQRLAAHAQEMRPQLKTKELQSRFDQLVKIEEANIQQQMEDQAWGEVKRKAELDWPGEGEVAEQRSLLEGRGPVSEDYAGRRKAQARQKAIDRRWEANFPEMEAVIARMPPGTQRDQFEVDLEGYREFPSMREGLDPDKALRKMLRAAEGNEFFPDNPYGGSSVQELMQGSMGDLSKLGVGEEAQPRPLKALGIDEKLQFEELVRKAAKSPSGTEENIRNLMLQVGVDPDSLTEKDIKEILGG